MRIARHSGFQVTAEPKTSVHAFLPQMNSVEFPKRIFSERSAILQRDEKPMTTFSRGESNKESERQRIRL